MLPDMTTDAALVRLLAPIAGATAAGSDPRSDTSPAAPYFAMKQARAMARGRARAQAFGDDASCPDEAWRAVLTAGDAILTSVGKDLEVAAWMVEASLHLHSLDGLVATLAVAAGLARAYGDALFPQPEEDGYCARMAAFEALLGGEREGLLAPALRNLPLARGAKAVTYWAYLQTEELARCNDAEQREARRAVGVLTHDAFAELTRSISGAEFQSMLNRLREAAAGLKELEQALANLPGAEPPSAAPLLALLHDMQDAVTLIAGGRLPAAPDAAACCGAKIAPMPESAPTPEPTTAGVAMASAGAPANRAEAQRLLGLVASWFRAHEPHSPLACTLEEALRRSRLTLEELLDELIPDPDSRRYFLIAAGIRPSE